MMTQHGGTTSLKRNFSYPPFGVEAVFRWSYFLTWCDADGSF